MLENGRVIGVAYFGSAGAAHVLHASHIILSAGAIGTPRILLNSNGAENQNGLANLSNQVGRNLMLHPLGYVEGLFDQELDTDIGPQGSMIFSLQNHRIRGEDGPLGYSMHCLRGTGPVEAALSALGRRKLRFGDDLYADFISVYRKQLVITLICEDLPRAENRVFLDQHNKDRFGMPCVMALRV